MQTQWFIYNPGPDDTGSDSTTTSSDDSSSTTPVDSASPSNNSADVTDSGSSDSSSDTTTATPSNNNDTPSTSGSGTDTASTSDPSETASTGGGTSPDNASDSADFDTDMQTIRNYVNSVVEVKSKVATTYLSAIDNFQTTVQTASPADAKPDILGAILKSGLKSVEKAAVKAVKDATGADLGPLVDMVHAIYDEIDRAAKAQQNLEAAEWIKSARTSITNVYTQDQTGEALRNQLETEYKNNSIGSRGGYIGGIQNELQAISTFKAPEEQFIEVAFYVAWINQYFSDDCVNGPGIISLQFEDDGTAGSATVIAPLGDKIAGALNNQMSAAGVSRLMDLDVVKKLCRGSACVCFEGNNVIRKSTLDDADQSFLSSEDNWKQFTRFS